MTIIYLTENNCRRYAIPLKKMVALEYGSLKKSLIMRRLYYV